MVEAKIEGDEIVIRLDIKALQIIASGGWACNALPPLEITDGALFADDLCRALNYEDEQGTTPIHRLFDKGINQAVENGALGCDVISEDAAEKLSAAFQAKPLPLKF